jgi:hypothetical protein
MGRGTAPGADRADQRGVVGLAGAWPGGAHRSGLRRLSGAVATSAGAREGDETPGYFYFASWGASTAPLAVPSPVASS